mgnify:CR=1 FL=1
MMLMENIGIILAIFLMVFVLELAFRKNRKEYGKAEKDRDIMMESQKESVNRQIESLAVLKDIKLVLQEISLKLDKK